MIPRLVDGALQFVAQLREPFEPLLVGESLILCMFQWHRVSDQPPQLVIALINLNEFGANFIPVPAPASCRMTHRGRCGKLQIAPLH